MELSYQTIKVTHQAREAVRKSNTKRNVPGTPIPLLLQADVCVAGCYGDQVAGRVADPLGPIGKVLGAGLEVISRC